MIDRRTLLQLTAAAGAAGLPFSIQNTANAQADEWRHGMSLFGDLKYPAGFENFDYVNVNAPKGGRARLFSVGTFDSLNPYSFKGNATSVIGLTVDSLMTSSLDEAGSEYGLIAESAQMPDDFSSVKFKLRPEAKFHDGSPVTPEDVIWSMTELKNAHPAYNFYYKNVVSGEKTGDREVMFKFSESGNRELPQIVGQLPVLSKAWWTGKNSKGEDRKLTETTLDAPLGNGAYKVASAKPGRSITLKRVDDYWGKDLPVNRGQNNFDEIFTIYYRDSTVALEAFKGDEYDFRVENSSKDWATAYDFPAVKRGDVIKEEITLKNSQGMQSFAINTRREKFADARVRQALNLAFDFEWANENLFFGQYKRTNSFFSNSELAATGTPGEAELAILEPLKDKLPPEVFTTEYTNPVYGSQKNKRKNLRSAAKLLQEAGWKVDANRVLRNAKGEPLSIEFLLVSPLFERIVLPYVQQLKLLGIQTRVRTVDDSQYTRHVQTFDFDIIVGSWGQSLSPGNEQRDFWGSASADRNGSRNLVGIKDEAVDQLIDKVIFAKDRDGLVAATKALDRALLWNHYVVPMWHIPYQRVAYWNRFGKPDVQPDHSLGFPSIWWFDEAKAAKVKS
ncbi:MAG: extracellular solute-binding protein [Pseudomonadota bacterium]